MNVFRRPIPAGLRPTVSHAERMNDVLRRLEREGRSDGIVGRASEFRAVLRATLTDWQEDRITDLDTRDAIVRDLDNLHRTAAKILRCSTTLDCCRGDDALTAAATPLALSFALSASLSAAVSSPSASTERGGWADSTEVLGRFYAEIALVDELARPLARRFPGSSARELRTFGLEGLLEAARRFDVARGVPFAQWARVQIRSAILDGVRLTGTRGNATAVAMAPEPESPAETPEEALANAQEVALLRTLLAGMPEDERQLLERHYFGEQTLAQAASALGMQAYSASRLHRRALDSLRRQLRADTV